MLDLVLEVDNNDSICRSKCLSNRTLLPGAALLMKEARGCILVHVGL